MNAAKKKTGKKENRGGRKKKGEEWDMQRGKRKEGDRKCKGREEVEKRKMGEIKWERELWDDRSGKEQTLRGEDESRVDHGSSPSAGRAWSGHVVIDLKICTFLLCAHLLAGLQHGMF